MTHTNTVYVITGCSNKERRVCDDGFIDSRRYRSAYGDKDDSSTKRPKSVVDFVVRTDEEQKEYDKRLKIIEVLYCM